MKLFYRVLFYVVGQFILAFGVAFAYNSQLGVSPVNSFPFAIAYALDKMESPGPGVFVSLVFCFYVLVQLLILRGKFKPKNFLQAIYATLFGYFVNIAKAVVGPFSFANLLPEDFAFAGQLAMLAVSILLIAFGLSLYLGADIVPMPMEGLTLTITSKMKKMSFHNMKIILDCTSVLLACAILWISTQSFTAIFNVNVVGIGTIVTALAVGPVMGLLAKVVRPWQQRLCFDLPADAREEKAAEDLEDEMEYE